MKTVFDSISLYAFQDLNLLNFDKLRQILFLLTLKILHFRCNEADRGLHNLISICLFCLLIQKNLLASLGVSLYHMVKPIDWGKTP